MMRLTILILLISTNYAKSNCDAEHSTTETVNEVSEKTESFSANPISLQSKAKNKKTENEASKTNKDSEEIRISRSSSDRTSKNETQSNDSSEIRSTEASLTEKTSTDEMISETLNKQSNKEVKEPTRRSDSANITEVGKKSSENLEKQLKELPEAARFAPKIEDRKAEDRLEASAETKLGNNEKASSKVVETDRNFNVDEIKEKSDELSLNKRLGTRRMISNHDQIIIDTKMRAYTTSKADPEVKTTFNQNLNTYNNFNEFETYSNSKLIGIIPTDTSSISDKTTMPVITNLRTQEIFNQRYLPKFYPRPELNINFPNINSDFQGPRDLPIYLKIKQDEYQSKNQFVETPTKQPFKSPEENINFNPGYQQQFHKSQSMLGTSGTLINQQFQNFRFESENKVPRIHENQVPTNYKSFIENEQLATLNQVSRNQGQQFHQNQGKTNINFKYLGDREPKNEEKGNPKTSLNNQGNQYSIFHQPEVKMNTKKYPNKKQFRYDDNNRFVNPYLQSPIPRHNNVLSAPARYIDNIIPTNTKLFQKLVSASEYPRRLSLKSYNNNNIQKYPYFINPNYRGDLYFYNISYIPSF